MALTVNVATPLDSVPVPNVVVPSRNVTVPVAAEGEVVAVNVTLEPVAGAVLEAPRDVVVAIVCAVTATAEDVLAA
jgi:hypothetical protein